MSFENTVRKEEIARNDVLHPFEELLFYFYQI